MNSRRAAETDAPREQPIVAFPWRAKNPLVSFRYAVEGIAHAFRTQRNMRFHVAAFAAMFLAGMVLRLPRLEMIALVFTCALVLMAEMFNTAIEATVDMITDRYHPAAKFVKDLAAGAVLLSAITAAVVGSIIFLGALKLEVARTRMLHPPTVPLFVGAFLLLLVVVLVLKIVAGKGTLLQGGVVSGHAAIAFFLAGTLIFIVPHPLVTILSLLLAALVAQSRVEAGIHTLREVVVGAVAALAVTALIFRLPPLIGKLLPTPPRATAQPDSDTDSP